jgi:hypothetical protein
MIRSAGPPFSPPKSCVNAGYEQETTLVTRKYDNDGHVKGAAGIDGSKSNDFSRRHMDLDAVEAQFGRVARDPGARRPVDTDYQGDADQKIAGSHILAGAREGNKPIMGGKRDVHHTAQTGIVPEHTRPTKRRWSGW